MQPLSRYTGGTGNRVYPCVEKEREYKMMDSNRGGALIRRLRQERGLTQRQLAERLHVSDRTVSKWECGAGSPEVSLLPELAELLRVRVEYLLGEEQVPNLADSGNLLRLRFYRCPNCGNLLTATGPAAITCCGAELRPLSAREPDEAHALLVERIEEDDYLTLAHPMEKAHYLAFFAQVDSGNLLLVRMYPEQAAAIRLPHLRCGKLYYACSRDGLFVCEPWRGSR